MATGKLEANRAIVIVMDVQASLLEAMWQAERVRQAASLLVQGANILNVPVLATTQYAQRLGPLVPDIAEHLPPDTHPFDKLTFSAWESAEFGQALRDSERQQVILCGLESHICVYQTARDLRAADYEVHLMTDGISSRTEANYRVGLERARHEGAVLSSVEMALYEMLERAGTPAFKLLLPLVR